MILALILAVQATAAAFVAGQFRRARAFLAGLALTLLACSIVAAFVNEVLA